jgi:cytochrome c-type biogenesis protein CcmE
MAMSTKAKIGLTVAVLLGAVGYMVFTTISSGSALEYFKHVEEVVRDPKPWLGQRLQVHGNVVAGTILKRDGSLDYKFGLYRGDEWMDVSFTGLVPDNFKDCAELVVTGKLLEQRRFHAEELSAKCPSKYDNQRTPGCGESLTAKVKSARGSN